MFRLGKQAKLLPVSSFCQLHSVSPNQQNCFSAPGVPVTLLMSRKSQELCCFSHLRLPSPSIRLQTWTTLICVAARSNRDPAVCLSSAYYRAWHHLQERRSLPYQTLHQEQPYTFLPSIWPSDVRINFTILARSRFGIFIYNISPVYRRIIQLYYLHRRLPNGRNARFAIRIKGIQCRLAPVTHMDHSCIAVSSYIL